MQYSEAFENIRRMVAGFNESRLSRDLEAAQRAFRSIAPRLEEISLAQQRLSAMVLEFDRIHEIARQAEEAYARFFQAIRLPNFERWAKIEQGAAAILISRGWWPHPEWPMRVLGDVIALKREGKIRQLDRMICSAYEAGNGARMRDSIDSWSDLAEFRMRRKIFRDGLWAYRKRRYGLAVTHWLPQIEGVLRSYCENHEFAQGSWKKVTHDITAEYEPYSEGFVGGFLHAVGSLYGDTLPRGRRSAKTTGFPIGRDAVLHGVDIRFGHRAKAMRVFLMLDTIRYFMKRYEEELSRQAA